MWCLRKMLGISWKEHRTNISILEEIGLERELMGKLARMKLQYFGHVTWGSAGNLALTVLEGSIDGLRHQGRPKRQWMDDIEEWSGCSYIQLKEMSQDREQWRRKTIERSSAVANRHRWWSTSEWVSEWVSVLYKFTLHILTYQQANMLLLHLLHIHLPYLETITSINNSNNFLQCDETCLLWCRLNGR